MKRLFCDDMTKTEAIIADTIVDNIEKMEFLGVEELAKLALVSNAMVVKYAKKIGFSGFKELKYYILTTRPSRYEKCNIYLHYQQQKVNDYYNYTNIYPQIVHTLVADLYKSKKVTLVCNNGTFKIGQYYQERLSFVLGVKVDILNTVSGLDKQIAKTNYQEAYIILASDVENDEIEDYCKLLENISAYSAIVYESGQYHGSIKSYKLCQVDIDYTYQFSRDRILFFLYLESVLNELMLMYTRKQ